jgi:hypothetical protein
MLVLDEPAESLAQAGGDQVGGVAEEYCRLVAGFWVSPVFLESNAHQYDSDDIGIRDRLPCH